MIDNLSITVQTWLMSMLTPLSADKILLPRYLNVSVCQVSDSLSKCFFVKCNELFFYAISFFPRSLFHPTRLLPGSVSLQYSSTESWNKLIILGENFCISWTMIIKELFENKRNYHFLKGLTTLALKDNLNWTIRIHFD